MAEHRNGLGALDAGGRPVEARTEALRPKTIGSRQLGKSPRLQFEPHDADIIAVLEKDGLFSYVSAAYEIVTGQAPDALFEGSDAWLEVIHPDDRTRAVRAHLAAMRGDAVDEEFRICSPFGETRWLHSRAYPIRDARGVLQRVIVASRDITELRRLREALDRARRVEALGTIATGIAHDFNNVLMGILGCAQLALKEDASVERARFYVREAAQAAQAGVDLANRLLTLGQEDGEPEITPMAIDAAIARMAPLLGALLGDQSRLAIDSCAPGAFVMAAPGLLEQIFMNLSANARDAMPNGGTVTIRTEVILRSVQIIVRDTGSGMDERTKARAFEPFFTTKDACMGTGLGLATVRTLTRQLGGSIALDSELGRGTTFTLTLPLARQNERTLQLPSGSALIVHNDPLVRTPIRYYFEDLGVHVLEASGVRDALNCCDAHDGSIDILVTGINADASRLNTFLKRRFPELRVVSVSTSPNDASIADGQVPADTVVLRPPFDREDVRAAFAKLLRKGSPRSTILLVEDNNAARGAIRDLFEDVGYRVLDAANASRALEIASRSATSVELLLTDVQLPGMNGDALAARLRQLWPELRVVFISGSHEPPAGARGTFLRKPVQRDVLVDVVRRELAG